MANRKTKNERSVRYSFLTGNLYNEKGKDGIYTDQTAHASVESEQIIIVQQLALPMSHEELHGVMTSISFATPLELANEAFVYWFEPT